MNGESWVVKCNVRAQQELFRSIDSLFGNVKNLVNISQTFWSQNVKLDLNVLHMVQKFSDLINMMIVFRRNVNADIQHNKCKLKRIMIVICLDVQGIILALNFLLTLEKLTTHSAHDHVSTCTRSREQKAVDTIKTKTTILICFQVFVSE